ncbi:MAG: hypothetical protein ACMUIL_06850 [bacterium]
MAMHKGKLFVVLLASLMLFSCARRKGLELEVKATLDGKPAANARILVDEMEEGVTDENGQFVKLIKRKPGREVQVSALMEAPGYETEPWKESFIMKIPPKGGVDRYSFQVDFTATKYITLAVAEKGNPLAGAAVTIGRKKAGATNEKGEVRYTYSTMPKKGFLVHVSKKGYSTWRKTVAFEPGQRLEVPLNKEAILTVAALTDEYGMEKGIPDVAVRIGKKIVGKTNAKGTFPYVWNGEPGKKMTLELAAEGYMPATWKTSVALEGRKTIQRFFYQAKPKPIRVGIYGYVSNTPEEDITGSLLRIEEAVGNNLFSYFSFKEVPTAELKEKMKQARLDTGEMITNGWQDTPLIETVDMIILGSVAMQAGDMTIETKVHTSNGKLLLSQINVARGDRDIKNTAKQIVRNILDQFPFEGTIVTAEKNGNYEINLGRNDYKVGTGMRFALMSPTTDKSGKITGYRDAGTLRVNNTDSMRSWVEIDSLNKGESVNIGDKVVRILYRDEEMRDAKNSCIILAKGGLAPDVNPLPGVNVYLEDKWVGTTGGDGKVVVPIRLGKSYDIVVYRHGYQRVSDEIRVDQEKGVKEFVLQVNNALFKVESQPSSAQVFVDEEKFGTTPLLEGKGVGFGFHRVLLSAGGDFRDWQEIMEFNEKVVDRTGNNRIRLFKDFLRIGEREEEEGDIDAAIASYLNAEKGHPDYSVIRCRLGRLYMDARDDYDAAIREFEKVLSLPENEQLIYKQFAVTHTNLGHAYYEKGDTLVTADRESAAQCFAKAITNLQVAKQNTRFFPAAYYDEALHDTYYYLAISLNKLYLVTKKASILENADLAWREYFDFFPDSLKENSTFMKMREAAETYWSQIQDLI